MEINRAISGWKKFCSVAVFAVLYVLFPLYTDAQVCKVKDGNMYIELKKDISEKDLDSFIEHFDLRDLSLKYLLKSGNPDSLDKTGWRIVVNTDKLLALSKQLISSEDLVNVADKIIFTSKDHGVSAMFPAVDNGQVFGYNRFRKKDGFAVNDSVVTFFLPGNLNVQRVMLAGSFTNWESGAIAMEKADNGWIANITLMPGKYWYKFIVDGKWMLDDDNYLRENDGEGNTNSVYYKTNYLFRLDTFTKAKKVYLAGSFNNWKPRETLMKQTGDGWELPVYLANGTHTYKYVVDGDWKTDPGNPDRFPNEFNEFNSVIHLGKPFQFSLKGYEYARSVLLTGTFNYWRKDELYMKRSGDCWEFSYALGPGNYEYKFIVDGMEIPDPDNPLQVNNKGSMNSYLVLEPNHTFKLAGFDNAKKVMLSGDFNGFNADHTFMKKKDAGWEFSLHLTRGKHLYKFVVDGKWTLDPANPLWEQNKYGTGDSVIWIEK